jgi:hypothetical protein
MRGFTSSDGAQLSQVTHYEDWMDRRRSTRGPIRMSRHVRRNLRYHQSPNLQLGRRHRELVDESRERPKLPLRRSVRQGPI